MFRTIVCLDTERFIEGGWRSTADLRCGREGRQEWQERKWKERKKNNNKWKKLAAEDEFKDKMVQRTDRNAPLYIIGAYLDMRHSDSLKKTKKNQPNMHKFSIPVPTSSPDFVVFIYHTPTRRHACARLHTRTYASLHSGTLLEIKQDPRQQPRPLKLQ